MRRQGVYGAILGVKEATWGLLGSFEIPTRLKCEILSRSAKCSGQDVNFDNRTEKTMYSSALESDTCPKARTKRNDTVRLHIYWPGLTN